MTSLRKVSVCVALLLVFGPVARAQGGAPASADAVREQIRKLEAMSLEGKSEAVQLIQRRALLRLYEQLADALRRDAQALREIQSVVGASDAQTQREVGGQLEALAKELGDAAAAVQRLSGALRDGGTSDAARAAAPAPGSESVAPPAASHDVSAPAIRHASVSAPSASQPHVSPPAVSEPSVSRPIVSPPSASTPAARPRVSNSASASGAAAPVSGNLFRMAAAPEPPQQTDAEEDTDQNDANDSFQAALNKTIDRVVAARINKRSDTKQAEAPSVSNASTSLVDQSEAGDLINVALNLAGLSATSENAEEADNVAVTASAYSLLAAAKQADPLNPGFYNRNKAWRKLSFTLGFDDNQEEDSAADAERAKIFGVKYLIINRRDATDLANSGELKKMTAHLRAATRRFGLLNKRVQGFLFSNRKVREQIIVPEFRAVLGGLMQAARTAGDAAEERRLNELAAQLEANQLFRVKADGTIPVRNLRAPTPDDWTPEEEMYLATFVSTYLNVGFRSKLSEEVVDDLDAFIEQELEDAGEFENLTRARRDALANILRRPQLSFYALTKQRDEGVDEYMGEAIFDYGVADRVNLTLNGSFNYFDSKTVGGDTRAARAAGQLQFRLTRQDLEGKRPVYLSVAGEGNWKSGTDFIYRLQSKLLVPIADGLDLPLSVTYTNRSELNDESTIRGQFGFTFDTARLFQAFLRR